MDGGIDASSASSPDQAINTPVLTGLLGRSQCLHLHSLIPPSVRTIGTGSSGMSSRLVGVSLVAVSVRAG
jgi:hypothetical protein